jgi:protoporphyrinogen oxidase
MRVVDNPENRGHPRVVIGAGPAGLTAAMELQKAGLPSVILEKDSVVGGLARTVCFKGYRFDLGGHRFFTKVDAVNRMWREVLGGDLLRRSRLSRIYFNGKYFDYPLRLSNAFVGLGLRTSFLAALSYFKAKVRPRLPEVSLEDWVTNRFGGVLYETFFKTYTEKVWGIPCAEIGADWAEQRIRGLSLYRAVMATLLLGPADKIKTLAKSFYYPRLGPGQMWENVQARLNAAGNPVLTEAEVISIKHDGHLITEASVSRGGELVRFPAPEVLSSMPLQELVERLDPPAPWTVLEAARSLRYRDFLTVALIVDRPDLFPDNWIYIHDPGVRVGRIQNFGNWSPDLVPIPGHSCLGLEYFCFKDGDLWSMDDGDLVALASNEVSALGLAPPSAIVDGTVVRMEKAYPVYDAEYRSRLKTIRTYLDSFRNLHPIGRNGLHKYNNQDHSMFTAMLAVRNILGENHDVWSVNADCEYHEEIREVPDVRSSAMGCDSDPRLLSAGKWGGRRSDVNH